MKHVEKIVEASHGGKRKGAGRPKGEGSKMVRVPIGCLEQVRGIIENYRTGSFSNLQAIQKERDSRPRASSVTDQGKKPVTQVHEDIEEVTLEFDRLPRVKRRLLIKQHGSKDKAIQAFIRTL